MNVKITAKISDRVVRLDQILNGRCFIYDEADRRKGVDATVYVKLNKGRIQQLHDTKTSFAVSQYRVPVREVSLFVELEEEVVEDAGPRPPYAVCLTLSEIELLEALLEGSGLSSTAVDTLKRKLVGARSASV